MGYRSGLRSLFFVGLVLVGAHVARADDVDREIGGVPGAFGDSLQSLELSPSYTLVPVDDVPAGIAIRDADPSRVKLFVDGFEVPTLLAGGRSLFFAGISSERRFDDGMDLAYGGATGGGLEIDTQAANGRWSQAALTVTDATVASTALHSLYGGPFAAGMRFSFLEPRRGRDLDLVTAGEHFDLQGRQEWRLSGHWSLAFTPIATEGGDNGFARATLTARYRDGGWQGTLAASALQGVSRESVDTRADFKRELRNVGGLKALELRIGENTSLAEVVQGAATPTQFDGGLWAALGAALGANVVALGGARLEIFDTQVALSPRGTIAALFGHIGVGLTASAYRQAQVDRDVTPERATEVTAIVQRRWTHQRISVTGYYIDRSRILVEPSATSVGTASGVGTATGIEARESWFGRHWTAYFAGAISHATRADRFTAPDHPADLDAPLRFDAVVAWHDHGWRIGVRGQLRSGLPYTPVTGAVYDGDTDTYSALYGKPNSDRAPFRRELDLRVDRQLGTHLHAYLDVAFNGGTLGYTYSDDYSQQLAIRAPPVLPWVGITGNL